MNPRGEDAPNVHDAPDALRALRIVTRARTGGSAAWRTTDAIEGGFLREVETRPTAHDPTPRAAYNGYAVDAGVRSEDELEIAGTLTPDGVLDADGGRPDAASLPGARTPPGEGRTWRVESGSRLPSWVVTIIPIADATVVGTRRVRIERDSPSGSGIDRGAPPRAGLLEGAFAGPRLRAELDAWGVARARVSHPFAVGVLAVGDELVDLAGLSHEEVPAVPASATVERTAVWLPDALGVLGLRAVPLGIVRDDPERVCELLLQAVFRQLAAVVLVGGIGDGLTDRTIEGIELFGARVRVRRLALDGCERFVYARGDGVEVFALSGHPRDAALAYDAFLRPALLARLGAAPEVWDWSRLLWPLESDPRWEDDRDTVRPARLLPRPDGSACIRVLESAARWLPRIPEQSGWALRRAIAPAGEGREGPPQRHWAHFVQLAVE